MKEREGNSHRLPFLDTYTGLIKDAAKQVHTDVTMMRVGDPEFMRAASHVLMIAAAVRASEAQST
jgi:hypothetical protein